MRTYQNFIGGDWLPASGGRVYQNHNPADRREIVAEYPLSGAGETRQAIEAATKSFPGFPKARRC